MEYKSNNRRLLIKLIVVAIAMFGFGYALVLFYKQICDSTGVRDLAQADHVANTQVDKSRTITIEFDANVRSELPWRFKSETLRMLVHPGEMNQVVYDVENSANRVIVGQAVPSYGPALAGRYFRKLECFCFRQQRFQPHEQRRMPVVFVVDAALPREVNTITLSYSFFEVAGTAAATTPPPTN